MTEIIQEFKMICDTKQYHKFFNYDINSINYIKLILYEIYDDIPEEIEEFLNKTIYKLNEDRNQDKLRKQLILRDKGCIVSNKHYNMCEVAHIHPFKDSTENEKYDINNVMLLGSDIHKIFDKYLWSINPDTYQIELSEKCRNEESYQMNPYDKKQLYLPKEMRPYLQMHYNEFKNRNNI